MTAFTSPKSQVVRAEGAKSVLAGVEANSYLIHLDKVEAAINPATRQ